jgi:hypothetical protein
MSHLGGLSKEFQFLLKLSIPFVIVLRKGVEVDATINGIKKEVEDIVPPAIDIRKEVVVLVSFEIKEEIEELEEINIMHNRTNMNGIPKPVLKYIIKYSKYLHCHWVQQLVVLKMSSSFKSNRGYKFLLFRHVTL